MRGGTGGIKALAGEIISYGDAIDYDLMTVLGLRLHDVPETIGWDGLLVFLKNLPMESAYVRALFPEEYAFSSGLKQAAMMADLIDSITWLRYEYALSVCGKKGKQPDLPKPYPTPWNKHATQADPLNGKYGKGAIPANEFYDWYYGEKEINDGN